MPNAEAPGAGWDGILPLLTLKSLKTPRMIYRTIAHASRPRIKAYGGTIIAACRVRAGDFTPTGFDCFGLHANELRAPATSMLDTTSATRPRTICREPSRSWSAPRLGWARRYAAERKVPPDEPRAAAPHFSPFADMKSARCSIFLPRGTMGRARRCNRVISLF